MQDSKDGQTGFESAPRSSAVSDRPLTILFKEDYFLLKILAYVTEDDLRECRCVCRRWYTACNEILDRVGEVSDMVKIPNVVNNFPNVTCLTISHLWLERRVDIIDIDLLPLPTQSSNLTGTESSLCRPPLTPEQLCSCLLSVHRLQSLTLQIYNEDTFHSVLSCLRHLKRLSSLNLDVRADIYSDPAPITELRELKELGAEYHVIVNRYGNLLFPCLTQLTKLRLADRSRPLRFFERMLRLFQAILPYSSTLQSVDLTNNSFRMQYLITTCEVLFMNLSTMDLCGIDRRESDFYDILRDMPNLTKLKILLASDASVETFRNCVSLLCRLKSLTVTGMWEWVISPGMTEFLTDLTKLTQLTIAAAHYGRSLFCLTDMVDLNLKCFTYSPDSILEALLCMPNLTNLRISRHGNLCAFCTEHITASILFQHITKLKTLLLTNFLLDIPFLEALAELPDLTELRFSDNTFYKTETHLFYAQLTLLRNLKVLNIPSPSPLLDPRAKLLDGCLTGLRVICFPLLYTYNYKTRSALLKAFPNLRYLPYPRPIDQRQRRTYPAF